MFKSGRRPIHTRSQIQSPGASRQQARHLRQKNFDLANQGSFMRGQAEGKGLEPLRQWNQRRVGFPPGVRDWCGTGTMACATDKPTIRRTGKLMH